jgi:hypothetical protein
MPVACIDNNPFNCTVLPLIAPAVGGLDRREPSSRTAAR